MLPVYTTFIKVAPTHYNTILLRVYLYLYYTASIHILLQ